MPDVGFCGANDPEESFGLVVGLVSNSSSFIFGFDNYCEFSVHFPDYGLTEREVINLKGKGHFTYKPAKVLRLLLVI